MTNGPYDSIVHKIPVAQNSKCKDLGNTIAKLQSSIGIVSAGQLFTADDMNHRGGKQRKLVKSHLRRISYVHTEVTTITLDSHIYTLGIHCHPD